MREQKQLLEMMIEAAHSAGQVLLRFRSRNIHVREKLGEGLVSDADTESEKTIIRKLRRFRDQFEVLAEESAPEQKARQKAGRWIIDPLDGTTNYVHGFPMFCVSIAAEWEGEVIAGVIHQPVLKETYTAMRGHGAFMNGKRLRVSQAARLPESLLSTGFTYQKNRMLQDEIKSFEAMSRVAGAIRRPGSAAMDLAFLARGIFDGFWERGLSPWDIAAGSLLVEEAGGKVTNFQGKQLGLWDRQILATNEKLHAPMLRILRTKNSSN